MSSLSVVDTITNLTSVIAKSSNESGSHSSGAVNKTYYMHIVIFILWLENLGQWETEYFRRNHTLFGFCLLFHV